MTEQRPNHSNPFPTTQWSLVVRAGDDPGPAQRAAVAALVERYAPALRSYLRTRWRVDEHEAADLVQGFLADKVIEQGLISRAERERGRFRTFLLTALDHFVSNTFRAARAQKRAPKSQVPLNEELDSPAGPAGRTSDQPAEAFDLAWGRQVLAEAIDRMRVECHAIGRPDLWGVFEGRILAPTLHQEAVTPYGELVRRFRFDSPTQASNALVTAGRMFRRILRQVVGGYEQDGAAVEEEIADLRRIFAAAGAGGR
jgi:RNA polymerase sigma-70 factor (ECF subfamily)